ncbi:hypothetical protein CEP52_017375 [Fusarium oligoseptatum]|uniref:Methyltransferase domain-containing protein n=1 Tax=Fusarium oligoseptatum TaxID=2604345 RepID=A0A428RSL2_9HYPO|nr:hypothetical protein CEP52_017375 [Fusarium oligoseptatum]
MASSPKPDNEQALYKLKRLSYVSKQSAYPDLRSGHERLGIKRVHERSDRILRLLPTRGEPVDDIAQTSSLLLHLLWYAMNDGKLYSSPTSHPRKVMDIGSGTCTWSMHFATQNPGSRVVAIDKSPFMPQYALPNLEMICEDLNLAHPFEESTADLLFFRQLVWSEDLGGLFRNALRLLKPGGWIEFTLLKPKPRRQHKAWLAWERLVRKIMLPLYEGLGFTLPEIELLAMGMRQELAEDMEFESFVVYAQKPPQTTTATLF